MSDTETSEQNPVPAVPSVRRRIAWNVAFNWTGMVAEASVGIITVPLLLHRLGDTAYGLWILIGALAGYFQFLDLGLRGSIGRYIAFYEAQKNEEALSRTLSTALAMLCGAGLLAFLGGLGLSVAFPYFVEVPTELVAEVRLALVVVSCNLAIIFLSFAFDAVLWGFQRFDLLNLIDIPTALMRLGLTFAFVHGDAGIMSLAWITLSTTIVSGLLKAALAFHVQSALKLRTSLIDRGQARELLGFGFWQFVGSVAKLSQRSLIPVAIATTVGVAMVVPFSIAQRLVEVAGRFMIAATGVLSPLATALHAQDNLQRQKKLFIEATRYCSYLSLFFVTGMVLLGRETIELWVGSGYSSSYTYLAILALGTFLPMAAHVSDSILIGMAKVKAVSIIAIADALLAIIAAFAFGRSGNLIGICLAIAISTTVFQGMIRPLIVCRIIDLSPKTILLKSVFPAVSLNLLPAMVLWSALQYETPKTWIGLMIYCVSFSLLTIGSMGLGLLGLRAGTKRGWLCLDPK